MNESALLNFRRTLLQQGRQREARTTMRAIGLIRGRKFREAEQCLHAAGLDYHEGAGSSWPRKAEVRDGMREARNLSSRYPTHLMAV